MCVFAILVLKTIPFCLWWSLGGNVQWACRCKWGGFIPWILIFYNILWVAEVGHYWRYPSLEKHLPKSGMGLWRGSLEPWLECCHCCGIYWAKEQSFGGNFWTIFPAWGMECNWWGWDLWKYLKLKIVLFLHCACFWGKHFNFCQCFEWSISTSLITWIDSFKIV